MNSIVTAPLAGEIIGPKDRTRVICALNPFSVRYATFYVQAGSSIAEIIDEARARQGLRFGTIRATINGHLITTELWARVRAKADTTVALRAVPTGSGSGLLRTLLLAAVAIVSLIVAGPFGAITLGLGSTGAAIAGGVISIGGALIVNALFPATATSSNDENETFSISGGQNDADRYGPVRVIFGERRVAPQYGAGPYTEIAGDDQYLMMLFVWGIGPLEITDIKIGETPIEEFEDVQIETLQGWPTDWSPTLYPSQVIEETLSVELGFSDTETRRTADNITRISVDVTAPAGAFLVDGENGKRYPLYVGVRVEYSLVGEFTRTEIANLIFTSEDEKTIRRNVWANVPAGQYDVHVTRYTDDDEDQYGDGDTVSDRVIWTALRGFRFEFALKFPKPVAYTAMRIRATNQLNGVVDTLNGRVRNILPEWNGSTWVPEQRTKNPAAHFRAVLQGPGTDRPRSNSVMDFDTIQEWSEWCVEKGFEYNAIVDKIVSIPDQLQEIATAGRAAVTMIDGKWSVVWPRDDDPVVAYFNPSNSWDFSSKRPFFRMPHAFRIQFANEEQNYEPDEMTVYDDGYDSSNATLFEVIEFAGITKPDLIWKFGRFHIAQLRLQPEEYALSVDFEGLAVHRGNRVQVNHDVPMWGLAFGRVKSAYTEGGTDYVVVNSPLPFNDVDTFVIRFRLPDNTSVVREVVSVSVDRYTAELTEGEGLPGYDDAFHYGKMGQEDVTLRVKSLAAGAKFSATLTLVDDAPAILDADTGEIPPFDSNITLPIDAYASPPFGLTINETVVSEGSEQPRVYLAWQMPALNGISVDRYELQLLPPFGVWTPWGQTASMTFDAGTLTPGDWTFRVRAVFTTGQFSRWHTVGPIEISGINRRPGTVQGFRVTTIGDTSTFFWTKAATDLVDHYELRFAAVGSDTSWGSAIVVASGIKGTSRSLATLSGTYLIRAVGPTGLYSSNSAVVTIGAGGDDANIVENIAESYPFAGAMESVAYDVGVGGLVLTSSYGYGFAASGLYHFVSGIDLGAVYTSRLSAVLSAFGIDELGMATDADSTLWEVVVQFRTTNDDPAGSPGPTWSSWRDLQVGDYKARGFEFRLRFVSEDGTESPCVASVTVTIDMPDRIQAASAIIIAPGGTRVTYATAFKGMDPALTIEALSLDPGDVYYLSGEDNTGFYIEFEDGVGTPISRTINYIARGYGVVSA